MLTLWNNPFLPVRERSDSRLSAKNYFDRLFEDTFSTMTHDLFTAPWANIGIENKKNEDGSLSVLVDVPGVKEQDITIETQDNILYVKGERKTAKSTYSISKSFSIPENYNAEDIKAELAEGVLTLTLLPKEVPKKEIKKIEITKK